MLLTLLDKAKEKFFVELAKTAARTITTTACAAITKKVVDTALAKIEGKNDTKIEEKKESTKKD